MNEESHLSADEMIVRLSGMMSPWRRVRAVWAVLGGLAGAVLIGSLWATEPAPLPGRTQLGFAVIVAFCLAWAVYGVWALRRRTALLAVDRVIAAWLAVAASAVTSALIVTIAVQRGSGVLAAFVGAVLLAVSGALAVQAHRRRTALLRRRDELRGH